MSEQLRRDWHKVQAVLVDAVIDADTFHEVMRATDALFHARLFYKSLMKESRGTEAAGNMLSAVSTQENP